MNLSPSLLSSDGVRNLARDDSTLEDDEVFQALQESLVLTALPLTPTLDEGHTQHDQTALAPAVHCDVVSPKEGIDLPASNPEPTFFDFNPEAPVFAPGALTDEFDNMHLHTIATQWLAAAQSWDDSVPSARFITWRVSPATGRRFCLDSREVVLYGDMENWRRRILQTWADQTDPMVPADIISVSPHPSSLEPGVAGHVIVQQHPLDTHAASLVTIVDPAVNHGLFRRQVHVFEDRSRPEDILFFTGYHMDCPRVAVCQVRLRDLLLPPQTPIPIRDGDAFEINILRTFLPDNWIPPTIPRHFA